MTYQQRYYKEIFLDTLPSDLTQYQTDDVIITADNTGENTIHITDTEEEAPANLTENDEVWINSITDETIRGNVLL